MALSDKIRSVPDFPKAGIVFKDITTLLADGPALRDTVDRMLNLFKEQDIDLVIGIESRGFIFASLLAYKRNIGMIPVRKPGKLPFDKISENYELEYGTDSLEIHIDAIKKDQNILIVDDLLATGGTVEATVRLVERLGGNVVGCCFLVELDFLHGRDKLKKHRIESLVHYDAE
jgi:adenine phosphoribosyltransferase